MTLHEFPNVVQGTPAWHDLRRGIVTASTIGKLLTPTLKVADNDTSRGLIATLAAERITGWTEPTSMNGDMIRGVEMEPYARNAYAEQRGATVTEVGFLVRDEPMPWDPSEVVYSIDDDIPRWSLGYSPDGLVGEDGLLEVKSPRQHTHMRTTLSGQVPDHYMAQCQAGLYVTGRDWIDWVSYCGGMPLVIIRVLPDPKWQAVIPEAVAAAEKRINALVADYLARVKDLPTTERIDLNRVELTA